MKTALVFAATAAVVSAQVTYNATTGIYTCAKPGQNYCAGESLGTDIIIRCDATGKGQPGRCTDNLDGEPPVGLNPALCYQTSDTSGDAACEKNCVVYGSTIFTLPASLCTPSYTASSSVVSPTSTSTSTSTSTTVTTYPPTTLSTTTATSTYVPPPLSTSTGGGSPPPPSGNGTCHTCGGNGGGSGSGSGGSGSGSGSGPATNTPHGPTSTSSGPGSVVTAGAAANKVGGALAAVGLAAAYLL